MTVLITIGQSTITVSVPPNCEYSTIKTVALVLVYTEVVIEAGVIAAVRSIGIPRFNTQCDC